MRFEALHLKRYGAFERRDLAFGPGLTVVFGPNEAGKSTCLRAIRDFLFRIPEGSPQVATFGSGLARIEASLTTASGAALRLERRYGRVRTLVGADGSPVGDEALSSLTGPIDRKRFVRLFGLDHEDLRRGGEELLRADGDVGRLIVEAGGGLRALLGKLGAVDRELDELFAPRRRQGRAFYEALDAYDAADRAARAAVLTGEAHDRDVRARADALREVEEARRAKREVAEASSRMGRVARVLPMLRRLDHLEAAIVGHADVADLPHDFATRCAALLREAEVAGGQLAEARSRRDDAARRLGEMVVDEALLAAEAEVRGLAERSAVARAARAEEAARRRELAGAEAQLDELRDMLGLGRDLDLDRSMPSPAVLRSVRELADRKAELDAQVDAALQAVRRRERAVAVAEARVATLAVGGADAPFGIGADALSTLPAARVEADVAEVAAERAERSAQAAAVCLGFPDGRQAALLRCPSSGRLEAEVAARDALQAELSRLTSAQADAEIERGAASAEIERLRRDGEVATVEGLVAARLVRDEAWGVVRTTLLGALPPMPDRDRLDLVDDFERTAADADLAADGRAVDAERAAALGQARRRASEADATVRAIGEAEGRIRLQLAARDDGLRAAFPDAWELHPDPSSLLAFSIQRDALLGLVAEAARARSGAEAVASRVAPAIALLELAEARLGSPSTPDRDLAGRVQVATEMIDRRRRDGDEYLREAARLPSLREELEEARDHLRRLEGAIADWTASWARAAEALGLRPDVTVRTGSDLAARWAGARGDMRSVAQARDVLARMAEAETELGREVAALADGLGLALPADAAAGGSALMARWAANEAVRVRRETFAPAAAAAAADLARAEARVARAGEALSALAAASGLADDDATLRGAMARRCAFDGLLSARDRLEEALRDAGDGLAPSLLRLEVGEADLDDVRAEVAHLAARSDELEARMEAAIGEGSRTEAALRSNEGLGSATGLAARREVAIVDMHGAIERFVDLKLARHLVDEAVRVVRDERQDPLIRDAGSIFGRMTRGAFSGLASDVGEDGKPVVVGVLPDGRGTRPAAALSDGTRDALFLAFRLASVKAYCGAAEPLPFVADDVLVHVDDERSAATLEVLAEFASVTQVMLFTHHRAVVRAAERLAGDGRATIALVEG